MRTPLTLLLLTLLACGDDDSPPTNDAGEVCESDSDCDDGIFCNGEETCDMGACVDGDAPCPDGMSCSESPAMCVGECATPDADGDGEPSVACGGNDCDDSDANRYPGNTEVCDTGNVDEDCNADTFGERDVDGDGQVSSECCNGSNCGPDCADGIPSVREGAAEVCNLRDDDCDGDVDEGVAVELHPDEDGDLHGTVMTVMGCADSAASSLTTIDCDDSDAQRHGAQLEVCDGLDNDCDTRVDEGVAPLTWYRDADGDLFGDSRR